MGFYSYRQRSPRPPWYRPRWKEKVWKGFVSPDGVCYGPVRNLSKFCQAFGLEENNMRALVRGKQKTCKGWRLAEDWDLLEAVRWEPTELEYYLMGKDGEGLGPIEDEADVRWVAKQIGWTAKQVKELASRGEGARKKGYEFVVLEKEV